MREPTKFEDDKIEKDWAKKDPFRGPKPIKSLNDFDKEFDEILKKFMSKKEKDANILKFIKSKDGNCH